MLQRSFGSMQFEIVGLDRWYIAEDGEQLIVDLLSLLEKYLL